MTFTTRLPGSLKARLAVLGLALSLVLGTAAPAAAGVGTSTGITAAAEATSGVVAGGGLEVAFSDLLVSSY